MDRHGKAWASNCKTNLAWIGSDQPGPEGPSAVRQRLARHSMARKGPAQLVKIGSVRLCMGIKRQPREIWRETRRKVWERDGHKCTHCDKHQDLKECHIDHIQSGRHGKNEMINLRTLCRRCHVLRLDHRHQGMIAKALKDGIIPPNWRELVWE